MSEIIPISSGTHALLVPETADHLFASCAQDPAKVLSALCNEYSRDIGTGWAFIPVSGCPGVVNLRAIRSDDCALLFGGVVGSSWYPPEGRHVHAVLARGAYSVRVSGYVENATQEVSDQQWVSRPLSHRAAYYAVRAARGTPASPRAISDALNSGFVNGTLKPDSMGKRPDDWQCFWAVPTAVRFTFLGEHRVHRYIDFTKGNVLHAGFTVSRNA